MEYGIIEKKIRLNSLYACYQNLFTEKQQAYFESYHHEDLSLAEIADNYGISRNAVHDQLKKVETLLESYEQKLELLATYTKYEQLLQTVLDSKTLEEAKAAIESERVTVEVSISSKGMKENGI